MKFKLAHMSYQKDIGPHITVVETTLRDFILQYVVGDNLFGFLSWLSRDWMYSVRWGPLDPEFGFADKSLGSKLFALSQWAGGGFGAWRREQTLGTLPVTKQWVEEHIPGASEWPWTDDDSELDDEDVTVSADECAQHDS